MEQKADILKKLDIPWFNQPLEDSLAALYVELDQQWKLFDQLRQGKLKHFEYDGPRKHLTWRKIKANKDEALQSGFMPNYRRVISPIFFVLLTSNATSCWR